MRQTLPPSAGSSLRLLLVAAALALTGACGDTPAETSGLGSLEITASTTGEDLDPDGYTVVVDGDESRSLGVDETVTSGDIPAGRYVLELTGVADNCEVQGQNPRTVRVSGGGTASTTFEVACDPIPGGLEVSASTTGDDPDSDGYRVLLAPGTDEERSRSIDDPNGSTTFTGLTDGEHTVELDGSSVANNCGLDEGEENPRPVTVAKGDTASTTFDITCTDAVGDLEVTTTTSGEDLDPDGYEVVIDGTQTDSIGPNDEITFEKLAAGDHDVELDPSSVAPNCSVGGDNPRAVNVPNGGTEAVTFDVDCSDALGRIQVVTVTDGADMDDEYEVAVDPETDSELRRDIGPNESTTFPPLPAGDHQIVISGLADNCEVAGQASRTVEVPVESTASTTFEISCDDIPGDLEVSASTTGEDQDPDGYTVALDPGTEDADTLAIDDPNGSTTFAGVTSEDHVVELVAASVEDNCFIVLGEDDEDGENPRTVTVEPNSTITTGFSVDCSDAVGSLEVTTETTGDDVDPDGYTVELDEGTGGSIGIDTTETFTGIPEGTRTVTLAGVAENCEVQDNGQAVQVAHDSTSTVTFDVSCVPAEGDLEVVASTTGDDQDTNGYTVTVVSADGTPSQMVGPNGTVTFIDLPEGEHTVEMDESTVEENCSVDGQNPTTDTVAHDSTTTVTFDVTCEVAVGSLEVSTSTTGDDLDPDGYTVQLDEGTGGAIGTDAIETFTGIPEGTRTVSLAGVAENCEVQGGSQDIEVAFDSTSTVDFAVECDDIPGDLDVSAETTGDDQDPDGYTVTVPTAEDTPSQTVPSNGTVTFPGLSSESHDVEIDTATVADNCTVDSPVTQTDTVPPGGTAEVTFQVSCEGRTGSLEVTTSTTGDDVDPDGYTVQVDQGTGGAIGIDATETFSDIPEGQRIVTLDGVASNCTVQNNGQEVQVDFEATTAVSFTIECSDVPGDLVASAETTGADQDSVGYTVTVTSAGGTPSETVPPNDAVTFAGLTSEQHTVEIDTATVADNCTVNSDTTQTATVPPSGVDTVTFDVSCDDVPGDLVVEANTTGDSLDADGYDVVLDPGTVNADTLGIADANGSTTFVGVTSEQHQVELDSATVAENCSLDAGEENPRQVTVPPDGTETTTFSLSCPATN